MKIRTISRSDCFSVSRFVTCLLVVGMLASLMLPARAFAATTGIEDASAAEISASPNVLDIVQRDERNRSIQSRPASLPTDRSDLYDLPEGAAVYKLGVATKLSLLMDNIYPFTYLESNLKRLERHNDVSTLKCYLDAEQKRIVWNMISEKTKQQIQNLSTADALNYIKSTAEYRQNADLKHDVDRLLTLFTGDEIRVCLEPIMSSAITEELDLDQLIALARSIVDTEEYRALAESVRPLSGYEQNQSTYATFDTNRLAAIYTDVCEAADAFWPNLVRSIENFQFIDPVAVSVPADR